MVDFSDQKASKVIQLSISTSIIVIFLNTVRCFVKTDAVTLEVNIWIEKVLRHEHLPSCCLLQPHPHVYFSQFGQEQSSLLVPSMWGSDFYEWMRKFVTEGIVNHPNLSINFVTCFVRPRVASCHSICSWINIHHLEKSFSYPMIPNVHGSVTDYAN